MLPEYREHLEAARLLAAGRDPEALVFTTMRGAPLSGSEARWWWLPPAQDVAGLPRTGFHALRRSYALALHARGVGALDARDPMGHATVAQKAETYQREGSPEGLLARLGCAVKGDAAEHDRDGGCGQPRPLLRSLPQVGRSGRPLTLAARQRR